jgi:hypothetical protein
MTTDPLHPSPHHPSLLHSTENTQQDDDTLKSFVVTCSTQNAEINKQTNKQTNKQKTVRLIAQQCRFSMPTYDATTTHKVKTEAHRLLVKMFHCVVINRTVEWALLIQSTPASKNQAYQEVTGLSDASQTLGLR